MSRPSLLRTVLPTVRIYQGSLTNKACCRTIASRHSILLEDHAPLQCSHSRTIRKPSGIDCFHERNGSHGYQFRTFTASSEATPEGNSINQQRTSALFVKRGDDRNVAVVDVDLDLASIFGDVATLRENIKQRGLEANFDVDKLVSTYVTYSNLNAEFTQLEEERDNVAEQMKILVKGKKDADFDEKRKSLVSRGKLVKKKIKAIQPELWDLEADVMLSGLRLPNCLSPSTPVADEVLETFGEIPEIECDMSYKDYFDGDFRYSNLCPSTFYMDHPIASTELKIIEVASRTLRDAGLTQFSCPDMTKATITEACGAVLTDAQSVLNLQLKAADLEAHQARGGDQTIVDKWDITLSLCGGSSLPAFLGFLFRMNLAASCLPQKWFSVGRHYKPVNVAPMERPSFFNTMQTTQMSLFAATRYGEEAEEVFKDYIHILWEMYSSFGMHMRFVKVGAKRLQQGESFATEIQAWLPSEKRYITVANLGMYDDFISRRLMVKWSDDVNDVYNSNYVHVIYGTAVNFPSLFPPTMEMGLLREPQ